MTDAITTLEDICARHGVKPDSVRSPHTSGDGVMEARREWLQTLRGYGWSTARISAETGFARSTINKSTTAVPGSIHDERGMPAPLPHTNAAWASLEGKWL